MLRYALFFLVEVFLFHCYAQQTDVEWVHAFQGGESVPQFTKCDEYGNIYTVGYFSGQPVDFDPSNGVKAMQSRGHRDIYISKWDKDGGFIWCRRFGGSLDDYGRTFCMDSENNIYIAGYCWNNCTYGNTESEDTVFSDLGYKRVLLKVSPDGNLIQSTVLSFNVFGLDVDLNGNVYSTGSFSDTTDFDPGSGEYLITAENGRFFIHKLNANGDFEWVRTYHGNYPFYGKALRCDKNNDIIVGGFYREPIDFDPSPDTLLLTPSEQGSQEGVILKMDEAGNLIWAYTLVGELSNINALSVDNNNDVLVSGMFQGIIDFNYGENDSIISSGTGFNPYDFEERNFLLKLSENGSFQWVRAFPKVLYGRVGLIAMDYLNAIYYATTFSGTVDIDPTSGSFFGTSNGWGDVYLTKLSPDGSFQWGLFYGGTEQDEPYSMVSTSDGTLYIGGFFRATCDFDPGVGDYTLSPSTPYGNGYIQKFASTLKADELQELGHSLIYPNPTRGLVFLKADYPVSFGSVRNGQGQELTVPNHGNQLDLSRLPTGVYFVTVLLEGKMEKVEKIIVH